MASGGLEIVFPVTTVFMPSSVDKTVADMNAKLSQASKSFKLDLPAMREGKSMVNMLGGIEEFTKMTDAATLGTGKLIATFKTIKTEKGIFKIQTGEVKELGDAFGGTTKIAKDYTQTEKNLQKAIDEGKVKLLSESQAMEKFQQIVKLTSTDTDKMAGDLTRYTAAADKNEKKLSGMRGTQVSAAKQSVAALKNEIETFTRLGKAGELTADNVKKLRDAFAGMNTAMEGTKTGANVFQSFSNRIANAIQQTIAYSFSIGLVYKAQQLFNDAVKYAIDLNTEMTKIQVLQAEGAQTPEQINDLAQSFNKLGQEMGASTLEIAKGSVEWFRQGRTVDETQKLMRASMMLSKLGAMDSADATNYLTSITNAFKVSVSDTATVVDKLIAVDNIAATSAGELATALRYTSESAALAGVGMEQLISYIGTVSTVTRQNAEMIGQAFKTMFARMTLIQGGGTDEEGWTISKVQKSLDAVGISMKEADGTFRNMGDVLEDTAAKWDTLGEREQIEIAVAIGGVRQKEAFLVLMNNMDKALQYQAAQTDATGLAMNRYGIYLESVQAKQGQLTAAMQALYSGTVNSNMIKWFLDAAIAVVKFIDSIGGIPPLLVEIIALMIIFNRESITNTLINTGKNIKNLVMSLVSLVTQQKLATISQIDMTIAQTLSMITGDSLVVTLEGMGYAAGTYKIAATGAAAATTALNAAMGLLGIAAIAITAIWQAYQKNLDNVKKAQEELTKAVNDYLGILDEFPEKQKTAIDLYNQIQIMIARRSSEGLSTEDEEKLTKLYNDLYSVVPNLKYSFDEFGNATLVAGQNMEDLEKATVDYYLATTLGNQDIATYFSDQAKMTTDANKAIDEAIQKRNTLNGIIEKGTENIDAEAKAYIDSVKNQGEWIPVMGGKSVFVPTATQMDKDLADALEKAMKDGTSGQVLQNMMTGWVQAASSSVSSNKGLISKQANDWKKMYMMVAHRAEPEYKNIRMAMELAAANNPELLAAMKEAEVDYQNQIGEARLAAEKAFYEKYGATSATATTEQLNAEFKAQMQIIDQLSPSLDALGKALMQTGDNSIALSDAILQTNTELEKLAKDTGLEIPIKSFNDLDNAAGTALDPAKVQAYRTELISWMMTNADLLSTNDILYNSLINKLIALAGTANTTLVEYTNETGAMAAVTEAQWTQMTQTIAQQLFSIAENQGIVFTDINGNSLTTVQQLQAALAAQLLSFESAAIQSGQKTAKIMADLAKYMADLFKFVTNLTPYEPAPINLPAAPSGGGGQKKDPRAEALEKQIKAYEDEIELMQEQLEIYDEQIDAIDDLIEIENRKKEVIQDQIDIYEKQKDAIDRQIDVLQQQIDLLDRQVEMLNRLTAEIDRQIEMYQREISLIDREIEMYERQKELIDSLIDAQEELIKPLEEQKDAIDKQLSSFKEAIDLQKEALQLRKEEADFLDELTKKNKALANLEAEIAIASLDTSEEGIARRLKLEEEAAAAREDLAKTQEDREYDLQVRGLDDAYAAFEKGMNAQKALLDDQIAKIQEIIDKYNTQKEAIDALIVPLEAEKLRINDIIYGLEQQKIPIEDAIFRLEQEKIRIEDLIYPLEQQKVALDELIYPLTLQQEAIDLIIHQYEDEKRAIEDLKKPIEDQIELIGDKIEVLQDELDLINEITKAMGGGPGGGGMLSALEQLRLKMIENGIVGAFNDAAMQRMLDINIAKYGDLTKAINVTIEEMKRLITESNNARAAAEAAFNAGPLNPGPSGWTPPMGPAIIVPTTPPVTPPVIPPPPRPPRHEGGFASEHGPDVFEGTLKDSEVFAKLLKGEYVATEDQMKTFLRKTLPNIATEINNMFSEKEKSLKLRGKNRLDVEPMGKNGSPQPPSFNIEAIKIISPTQRSSGELTRPISSNPRENTYRDMNFEMNINVNGSLDKTVLPKLKKDVIKEINKSLERRGIRRTADSFAI